MRSYEDWTTEELSLLIQGLSVSERYLDLGIRRGDVMRLRSEICEEVSERVTRQRDAFRQRVIAAKAAQC